LAISSVEPVVGGRRLKPDLERPQLLRQVRQRVLDAVARQHELGQLSARGKLPERFRDRELEVELFDRSEAWG
jgi:hypothetical protein